MLCVDAELPTSWRSEYGACSFCQHSLMLRAVYSRSNSHLLQYCIAILMSQLHAVSRIYVHCVLQEDKTAQRCFPVALHCPECRCQLLHLLQLPTVACTTCTPTAVETTWSQYSHRKLPKLTRVWRNAAGHPTAVHWDSKG